MAFVLPPDARLRLANAIGKFVICHKEHEPAKQDVLLAILDGFLTSGDIVARAAERGRTISHPGLLQQILLTQLHLPYGAPPQQTVSGADVQQNAGNSSFNFSGNQGHSMFQGAPMIHPQSSSSSSDAASNNSPYWNLPAQKQHPQAQRPAATQPTVPQGYVPTPAPPNYERFLDVFSRRVRERHRDALERYRSVLKLLLMLRSILASYKEPDILQIKALLLYLDSAIQEPFRPNDFSINRRLYANVMVVLNCVYLRLDYEDRVLMWKSEFFKWSALPPQSRKAPPRAPRPFSLALQLVEFFASVEGQLLEPHLQPLDPAKPYIGSASSAGDANARWPHRRSASRGSLPNALPTAENASAGAPASFHFPTSNVPHDLPVRTPPQPSNALAKAKMSCRMSPPRSAIENGNASTRAKSRPSTDVDTLDLTIDPAEPVAALAAPKTPLPADRDAPSVTESTMAKENPDAAQAEEFHTMEIMQQASHVTPMNALESNDEAMIQLQQENMEIAAFRTALAAPPMTRAAPHPATPSMQASAVENVSAPGLLGSLQRGDTGLPPTPMLDPPSTTTAPHKPHTFISPEQHPPGRPALEQLAQWQPALELSNAETPADVGKARAAITNDDRLQALPNAFRGLGPEKAAAWQQIMGTPRLPETMDAKLASAIPEPEHIAGDVLRALGLHPSMPPLNQCLSYLLNFGITNVNTDLSKIDWAVLKKTINVDSVLKVLEKERKAAAEKQAMLPEWFLRPQKPRGASIDTAAPAPPPNPPKLKMRKRPSVPRAGSGSFSEPGGTVLARLDPQPTPQEQKSKEVEKPAVSVRFTSPATQKGPKKRPTSQRDGSPRGQKRLCTAFVPSKPGRSVSAQSPQSAPSTPANPAWGISKMGRSNSLERAAAAAGAVAGAGVKLGGLKRTSDGRPKLSEVLKARLANVKGAVSKPVQEDKRSHEARRSTSVHVNGTSSDSNGLAQSSSVPALNGVPIKKIVASSSARNDDTATTPPVVTKPSPVRKPSSDSNALSVAKPVTTPSNRSPAEQTDDVSISALLSAEIRTPAARAEHNEPPADNVTLSATASLPAKPGAYILESNKAHATSTEPVDRRNPADATPSQRVTTEIRRLPLVNTTTGTNNAESAHKQLLAKRTPRTVTAETLQGSSSPKTLQNQAATAEKPQGQSPANATPTRTSSGEMVENSTSAKSNHANTVNTDPRKVKPLVTPDRDPRTSEEKHGRMRSHEAPPFYFESEPTATERKPKDSSSTKTARRIIAEIKAEADQHGTVSHPAGKSQKFPIFACKWDGCKAELHNFKTLAGHLNLVHGNVTSHGYHVCWWESCYVPGSRQRYGFMNAGTWQHHMVEKHLIPVRQTLGLGPTIVLNHPPPSPSGPPLSPSQIFGPALDADQRRSIPVVAGPAQSQQHPQTGAKT